MRSGGDNGTCSGIGGILGCAGIMRIAVEVMHRLESKIVAAATSTAA